MCLGCVWFPILGSCIGGSLALNPKAPAPVKMMSMVSTSILTLKTVSLAKARLGISFCGTEGFQIGRAAVIILGSLLIGAIYSIGINFILNRWLSLPEENDKNNNATKPCCCSKDKG